MDVSAVRVDASGLHLPGDLPPDLVLDVRLGGRRIWSCKPARDAVQGDIRWPAVLRRSLQGLADLEVAVAGGDTLLRRQVRFGSGEGTADLRDDEGHPLTVDKNGRLQRTFDAADDTMRALILDATSRVLRVLRDECGKEAFLAYGCLLGAVRDGRMIGHDNDADVAYLSRHTHPFDVIRESRALRRKVTELGWPVSELSSAAFKVWLPLPDGRRCGIDVFSSFYVGETFHLMGSLRRDLPRSVVLPLGTVVLEGVRMPAPADPGRFLAACYGPGWQVPDPAFSFDHDPVDIRRMDSWFRQHRRGHRYWTDFYRSGRAKTLPPDESGFAHWVHERLPEPVQLLDMGCGGGQDAVWFAERGHDVLAMDLSLEARETTARRAAERGVACGTHPLNLEHLRRVLSLGARLARSPRPRAMYARGMVDVLSPHGRANLWRLASMSLRAGGALHVEFRTPATGGRRSVYGRRARVRVEPGVVVGEIEAAGGRVDERVTERGLDPAAGGAEMCRLVARWR